MHDTEEPVFRTWLAARQEVTFLRRYFLKRLFVLTVLVLTFFQALVVTATAAEKGTRVERVQFAKDAVIPGTPFHASTKIACVPYIEKFRDKKQQECEAFVTRRGFDGTATTIITFDTDERYEIFDALIFGG